MRSLQAFIAVMFWAASLTASAAVDVDRTLRTIDFEERRLGNPEELPMHWAKLEGQGRPHYVNGRLATDRARSGKYSFRFELNGGSLSYRYDAGRIRVRPGAHYRVEAWVQTTPLPHARARLSVCPVDSDGKVIAASVRHSAMFATEAADAEGPSWQRLSVELTAPKDADSLVLELALLQPAHYSPDTLGDRALFPQDIRGVAWFDDVTVAQVPKVTMSTARPGNIFGRGQKPAITVLVNDRSTDDLAARLMVRNVHGSTVHQLSGAVDMTAAETPAPGLRRMHLPLPQLAPGWYEAELEMSSAGRFVARQTMHLVQLADSGEPVRPDERFGVIATHLPFAGWSELPQVLPIIGAGRVKLPVWSAMGDVQQADPEGFDRVLSALREAGVTPTGCLVDLPPDIAKELGVLPGESSWSGILKGKRERWQPRLAYLVARQANQLDRWQLGDDGSDVFVARPEMREVYQRVHAEFAKLVQRPDLAMPWPAWHELDSRNMPETVALSLPASVLPHQVPMYMEEARQQEGRRLSLMLKVLDREKYGRETQVRDLAQRVIHALAAGAQRMDLPLPFTVRTEGEEVSRQPQELLMVIRTLTATLSGATFKSKVPIAAEVEAFLFEKEGQGILAVWDRGQLADTRGSLKQLTLNLGARPRMVDLWGNVTPLLRTTADRTSQNVRVSIGAMPVFLIDVDGALAQLRASIAFDRPLIESSFVPHRRKIRFANPYKQAIAGTLRLKAPAGWTITPPSMTFSLNPGEVFERDLAVEIPYSSLAGVKPVLASFDYQADQPVKLEVPLTLSLGLSDVGLQTLASRDGGDLLVQQVITNYGEKKIDYTAFVVVPGSARQERLVTGLAPGRSAVKLYRFPDTTGGVKVRSGVKETAGTRILNDEVVVE